MSDNPAADKDWEEAEFRAQVLAKLPDQLSPGTVEWTMGHLEISRATLFRPLKQFRADGRTRALLPDTRGPKPGMLPMDPGVEAIVSDHFRDFYATRRKPTKTEFWREVVSYATPPAQPCRTCWVLSGPRHWRHLPKPVLQFSMPGRAGKGGGLGPAEILAVLTTRHRRASPPSIAEQPRMSLQTRRDYHDFLTTPIIRQALTVVVPEYDQVAPVLAKPVRSGLHALAQSSLLQAFALTVGVGRIVEEPITRVIDVLLASDAEGQGRVRDALKTWPLSPRRRISAGFWRAQRGEREHQIVEKATKQRQSHKPRLIQSHKYRYRIS